MKKLTILIILILLPLLLRSQGFMIGFEGGLEFSGMRDLRNFNIRHRHDLPFSTRLVADFPGYWYYQPMIRIRFNKAGLGLEYSYNSTGSRLSGKDYSGEYRLDMRISRKSPGIFCEYCLYSEKKFAFRIISGGGMIFSSLAIKENLKVNGVSLTDESISLRALNYYFQPGLKISCPVNPVELELNIAYLVQIGKGPFHVRENNKMVLVDESTGDPVKPGWNGLKLGIAVNYVLKRRSDAKHVLIYNPSQ